jgi:hypothetical protein
MNEQDTTLRHAMQRYIEGEWLGGGAEPEEDAHWRQWIIEKVPDLARDYYDELETERRLADLYKPDKWQAWLKGRLFFLVEEWREDWNWHSRK